MILGPALCFVTTLSYFGLNEVARDMGGALPLPAQRPAVRNLPGRLQYAAHVHPAGSVHWRGPRWRAAVHGRGRRGHGCYCERRGGLCSSGGAATCVGRLCRLCVWPEVVKDGGQTAQDHISGSDSQHCFRHLELHHAAQRGVASDDGGVARPRSKSIPPPQQSEEGPALQPGPHSSLGRAVLGNIGAIGTRLSMDHGLHVPKMQVQR